MTIQELLYTLDASASPSGFEKPAIDCIEGCIRPYAPELHRTPLGALIARRPGTGKRVLFTAPADTPGFLVTYREESGFFRFGLLGSAPVASLIGLPVRSSGGARGVIGLDGDTDANKAAIHNLFIDPVRGDIRVGDAFIPDLPLTTEGGTVATPALFGIAACASLITLLSREISTECDVYCAFTTHQEVGERGAASVAFDSTPDVAVAVELALSGDTPESRRRGGVTLGGGPALALKTGGAASNIELLQLLESKATFPVQRTADTGRPSNLGEIQSTRSGVTAAVVGIPARMHGLMGIARTDDIEKVADLLAALL